MGGMTSSQLAKVLTLSILLLVVALFSAHAHAAITNKVDLIERMEAWKEEVAGRQDLELRERDLEIHLISRLIFQTESKFYDQDLNLFLQKTCEEMQDTDDDFGPFLGALHEGLQTLLEKNEDPLSFAQSFLDFSSIQDPASATQFSEVRGYYDGHRMIPAQAMNVDEAADYLEQKEKAAAEFKSSAYSSWVQGPEDLTQEYKDLKPQTTEDLSVP
jgi:hypothetical protein